jgi:hypothetical protein
MIKRDDPRFMEYILRVWKLMEAPRLLSLNAAKIVVLAAMYGDGCVEDGATEKLVRRQHGAQ